MKIKDTFSLSETHTNAFWDRVIYVEVWHSSGNSYVFCPQLFAEIIGVEGEVERMIEENFAKILEEGQRKREIRGCKRKEKK